MPRRHAAVGNCLLDGLLVAQNVSMAQERKRTDLPRTMTAGASVVKDRCNVVKRHRCAGLKGGCAVTGLNVTTRGLSNRPGDRLSRQDLLDGCIEIAASRL